MRHMQARAWMKTQRLAFSDSDQTRESNVFSSKCSKFTGRQITTGTRKYLEAKVPMQLGSLCQVMKARVPRAQSERYVW